MIVLSPAGAITLATVLIVWAVFTAVLQRRYREALEANRGAFERGYEAGYDVGYDQGSEDEYF